MTKLTRNDIVKVIVADRKELREDELHRLTAAVYDLNCDFTKAITEYVRKNWSALISELRLATNSDVFITCDFFMADDAVIPPVVMVRLVNTTIPYAATTTVVIPVVIRESLLARMEDVQTAVIARVEFEKRSTAAADMKASATVEVIKQQINESIGGAALLAAIKEFNRE